MTTPTHNVQGSDADRAEGGLDVENAFTDLDQATASRLGAEARAQQGTQGARRGGGRNAVDMLTSEANTESASEEYHYEGP